jgi:O-antigen/teichoic acid export membrane protein
MRGGDLAAGSTAAQAGEAIAAERRLATGGKAKLLLARFAFLGLGMVVSIVLARQLGPAAFGTYGVLMTLLTWLEMTIGGGMPGATNKVLADNPEAAGAVEQTSRLICLVLGLLLFAAGWVAAPSLAELFNVPDSEWLFRLAFADAPLMAAFYAAQGMLFGTRRFGLYAAALTLMSLAKLAMVLILVGMGFGLVGAMLAHLAASALALLFVLVRMPPSRAVPSLALARAILRVALGLATYGVALQLLTNLNLWQLKALTPEDSAAAGLFVAALNVARVLTVVPSAVSPVVFSTVTHAAAAADAAAARRHVEDGMRFALLLAAPAVALLLADAAPIIELLFGEVYAEAAPVLQLLAVVFGTIALLDVLCQAKMAYASSAGAPMLVAVLALAAFVAGWHLIPEGEAAGAALAQLLPLVVGIVLAALLAARRFGRVLPPLPAARILGMATVTWGLALVLPGEGIWLLAELALCGLVYLGGLALVRELRPEDLAAFGLARRPAP